MPEAQTDIRNGLLLVRQTQDEGSTLLALEGELDLANAHTLELTLHEALHRGDEVIVDLGKLQFIDSTGISLLVMALRSPHAERLSFRPSESPEVCRLFSLTGLDQRLGFRSAPPVKPA
ncbi:MAG TPA: STAS domain-containing protein [Solirubrobacterales bacterium]|nr:STAS domain-containing protein [Solirubrobacterales bacterium]